MKVDGMVKYFSSVNVGPLKGITILFWQKSYNFTGMVKPFSRHQHHDFQRCVMRVAVAAGRSEFPRGCSCHVACQSSLHVGVAPPLSPRHFPVHPPSDAWLLRRIYTFHTPTPSATVEIGRFSCVVTALSWCGMHAPLSKTTIFDCSVYNIHT